MGFRVGLLLSEVSPGHQIPNDGKPVQRNQLCLCEASKMNARWWSKIGRTQKTSVFALTPALADVCGVYSPCVIIAEFCYIPSWSASHVNRLSSTKPTTFVCSAAKQTDASDGHRPVWPSA